MYIGSSLPVFEDKLSAPSSRVRHSKENLDCLTFEDGTDSAETLVTTNLRRVTSQKNGDLSVSLL